MKFTTKLSKNDNGYIMKLEKKDNKLTGKYVKNMRETYIDDDTKILFLKQHVRIY